MSPLNHVVSNAQAASTMNTATITSNEQKEQTLEPGQTIDTNKPTDQPTPSVLVFRHQQSNAQSLTEDEELWLEAAEQGDFVTIHTMIDTIHNMDCVDRWGS